MSIEQAGIDQAVRADSAFLRAIGYGAALGVPALWALLTVVFSVLTDESLWTVAGYSALPAVFCGPFLGGLVTTARVEAHA